MYTLAVMLVWNMGLKIESRCRRISDLCQRQGVGHQVHPQVVRVGLTQPGDGEGEGGEEQVEGVHYGQDEKELVESFLLIKLGKIENTEKRQ